MPVARSRRGRRFIRHILAHTPILQLTMLLVGLWIVFAAALYLSERGADGTAITSYGRALYWGIAAFSTAGIADTPLNGWSLVIGGAWIVTGSLLFFGVIVATVTAYFMRPLQRPSRRIVETIESSLEQLEDLSLAELELLRETTNSLIEHVERLRARRQRERDRG